VSAFILTNTDNELLGSVAAVSKKIKVAISRTVLLSKLSAHGKTFLSGKIGLLRT
jgi:hypothetical protein